MPHKCTQNATRWAHLRKIERRWEKTKKTYHESGKHSYWAAPSVVRRNELRLLKVDQELARARALVGHFNNGWRRARSCYILGKRLSQEENIVSEEKTEENFRLYQLAFNRYRDWKPWAVPGWKHMWPGLSHDFHDDIARRYGLATTWGVMHARDLIEPKDPERGAPPAAKATPAFEEDPQGAMEALLGSYDNLIEKNEALMARCDQDLEKLAAMKHALDLYSQSLR